MICISEHKIKYIFLVESINKGKTVCCGNISALGHIIQKLGFFNYFFSQISALEVIFNLILVHFLQTLVFNVRQTPEKYNLKSCKHFVRSTCSTNDRKRRSPRKYLVFKLFSVLQFG